MLNFLIIRNIITCSCEQTPRLCIQRSLELCTILDAPRYLCCNFQSLNTGYLQDSMNWSHNYRQQIQKRYVECTLTTYDTIRYCICDMPFEAVLSTFVMITCILGGILHYFWNISTFFPYRGY